MNKSYLLEQIDFDTWQVTYFEDDEEVGSSQYATADEAATAGEYFVLGSLNAS